jgi:hypothetical protein
MNVQQHLRVYLGGPSRELPRVRHYATALESTGAVMLTSRWFDGAEEWAGRDSLLEDAEQLRRLRANLSAMRRADVV